MNNRLRASIAVFVILSIVFCIPCIGLAHSGRTDSSGGHYDRKTGRYHYHGGSGSSSSSGSSSTKKTTASPTAKPTVKPTAKPTPKVTPTPTATATPIAAQISNENGTMFYCTTGKDLVPLYSSTSTKAEVVALYKKAGILLDLYEIYSGPTMEWHAVWYKGKIAYVSIDHVTDIVAYKICRTDGCSMPAGIQRIYCHKHCVASY